VILPMKSFLYEGTASIMLRAIVEGLYWREMSWNRLSVRIMLVSRKGSMRSPYGPSAGSKACSYMQTVKSTTRTDGMQQNMRTANKLHQSWTVTCIMYSIVF
jgi:hypothetical protein